MVSQHRCSLPWAGQMGFGGLISFFGLVGVGDSATASCELGASRDQLRCSAALLPATAPGPIPGHETLIALLAEGARAQPRKQLAGTGT